MRLFSVFADAIVRQGGNDKKARTGPAISVGVWMVHTCSNHCSAGLGVLVAKISSCTHLLRPKHHNAGVERRKRSCCAGAWVVHVCSIHSPAASRNPDRQPVQPHPCASPLVVLHPCNPDRARVHLSHLWLRHRPGPHRAELLRHDPQMDRHLNHRCHCDTGTASVVHFQPF